MEIAHGLASVAGGRHEAWGTANRIVPLGGSYLELVAIVDRPRAAGSEFGRWVEAAAKGGPTGWVVRTRELDAVAARLTLAPRGGSRVAPDGRRLHWRTAGMETAAREPCLPFFIEWAHGTVSPGTTPVQHSAASVRLERLVVEGDPARIAAWIGAEVPALEIRPGPPRVAEVHLAAGGGSIVLAASSI
jgi:Glyoxalase-like domain